MDWLTDQEDSRPQPPPTLDVTTARALFQNPTLVFCPSRSGLQSLTTRRHALLACLPANCRRLEKAERLYSDGLPKTAVGQAHEWNECRATAEDLLRLTRAYLSLLLEEEGE